MREIIMLNKILEGIWTYRSYLNDPMLIGNDPKRALAQIFGEGVLTFTHCDENNFKSVLDFGGGAEMDLFGTIVKGSGLNPATLLITGTGREETSTAKWVYQYQGFVVPAWAEGVKQVPAIVGTVIRTIPHGSGPAGVVASFILIKHS
jgi:hypothetical protein